MTRRACGTAVALLLLSLVSPVRGEQYLLYSPKPVGSDETVQTKDGVLVREVPVQKGDTLSGISRKYSGHGSYYSQILLFNDIKNPNLIYSGDTLKVPVTKGPAEEETGNAPERKAKSAVRPGRKARRHHAATSSHPRKQHAAKQAAGAATELSLGELKQLEKKQPSKRTVAGEARGAAKQAKGATTRKTGPAAAQSAQAVAARQEQHQVTAASTSGQRLFEQALKAYRQEECRAALELFDRFLAENSASPQAADASLYKADCYMKLSAQ